MLEAQSSSRLALLAVLLVHSVASVCGHCWESSWCQDLDTEAEAMAEAEPGAEAEAERQARPEGKRSYAMEHFRWGKPVGRKRRPVKVFPAEAEEESAEGAARELRRGLSWDAPPGDGEPPEEAPHDGAAYRMRHFRWNAPAAPKKKRYGGFLAAERGHAPLLTLLRSAVAPGASPRGQ
ncbi:pro-opiomelanocortin [Varanus komodoensis]|uniref:pro-opiomelanocortin n=1 Tax=Varanus komodoensis TaxID=61221 RepID=UPI001CF7AA33|nr:pro-opiomelanocortin [Varanus komodoensis]